MPSNCPVCGAGTAKKVKRTYETKYDGQIVTLPNTKMLRCSNCNEEFLLPDQARAISIEVKNEVRRSTGLLPPGQILAIRKKLSLTQAQLERLFDQGPKVITRWESGKVIQNKNADTILRMLDRKPTLLSLVKEIERARDQRRKQKRSEPLEVVVSR